MSSDADIVNGALTLLGETRIVSLDDEIKPAREAKAIYSRLRDKLLARYNWSFAMTRVLLSPLGTAPLFQFSHQYLLPGDCIRIVMVAEQLVGLDLSAYRNQPNEDYVIEGRNIMTDLENPLRLRYVKRITDPGFFPPAFDWGLSCELAYNLAEPLTQSRSKRDAADAERRKSISDAVLANAIELPPKKLADDEWINSRL